jgi:dihydromethanopterin reductase
MPWEGDRDVVYKDDVERFFALTKGHVVIAGPITFSAFPDWARLNRTVVEIHAADEPAAVLASFAGRVVFVGGGPPVWNVYASFVVHWDITRLPYDGEADRYFDPAWLCAGSTDLQIDQK